VSFDSVSIDARRVQPGGLFVALPGSRVDGHDFIAQAPANAAVAPQAQRPPDDALPQPVLRDRQLALGQLGALNRTAFRHPLVAITGSSGKTTVKEMLAAILRECGPVLATRGNLNNELGVPLTLLELAPEHRFAVVEMGAGAVGDIAYCMQLARPQVGVLTNAGVAHIGRFGSEEAIARTKREIFAGLDADGQGVINLDSPWQADWQATLGQRKRWSFSIEDCRADLHARNIQLDQRGCPGFELMSPLGSQHVQLNLLGRHNVANALAAAAAALALDIPLQAIADGLAAPPPVAGRGRRLPRHPGALVIDDTYSAGAGRRLPGHHGARAIGHPSTADPGRVRAAIDVLAALDGQRILGLGDMGERGATEQRARRDIGEYARSHGLDALYSTGPLSALAAEAFGLGGHNFADRAALAAALNNELNPRTRVLVKGSRSAGMEEVVAALVEGSQHQEEGKPTCC